MLNSRARIPLVIVDLFLVLLCGFSYGEDAQGKSNSKPSNQSQKSETITNPSSINSQISPSNIPKTESDYYEKNSEWKVGDSINAVLVLITGVLAWFTYGLFRETKRLVDSSADTDKIEFRAYVFVDVDSDESYKLEASGDNYVFSFMPIFKNTGKTPAHKVKYDLFAGVKKFTTQPDVKYIKHPEEDYAFTSIGPGGHEQGLIALEPIKKDVFYALVRSNTEKIYVCGVVTYEDVFGFEWKTEFSYWSKMSFIGSVEGSMQFHCAWRNTKYRNNAT